MFFNLSLLGAIEWEKSLSEAYGKAKETGKSLLVYAYENNEWCKQLEEKTFTDTEVTRYSKNFVCVKVSPKGSEEERRFCYANNFKAGPTVYFLDSRENEIYTHLGYTIASVFLRAMKSVAERDNTESYIRQVNAGTYNNASTLMAILIREKRIVDAEKVFAILHKNNAVEKEALTRICIDLGQYYAKEKNMAAAIKSFSVIVNKCYGTPSYYEGAYNYAYALYAVGKRNAAITFMEKTLADKNMSEQYKEHYRYILFHWKRLEQH